MATLIVPFLTRGGLGKPRGATRAWLTYDAENLYLAFDCREPNMEEMKAVGTQRDAADFHQGDAVYCLLSANEEPVPFVNLGVNPDNLQWDAGTNMDWQRLASDVAHFNASWKSAVRRDGTGWTVEMAVPWEVLGIPAPRDGHTLRANFGRKRWAGGWELISWAPVIKASGFDYGVEPYHFGYVTLRHHLIQSPLH